MGQVYEKKMILLGKCYFYKPAYALFGPTAYLRNRIYRLTC